MVTVATKDIVAIIVGIAALGLGLAASDHYISRRNEQRKVEDTPQLVQYTEQARARVRGYFSDEFITPKEASDLYWIARGVSDSRTLRDSAYFTTKEGARISSELFGMRHEFWGGEGRKIAVGKDVSGSDLGTRLDKLLEDYAEYLQTAEYSGLVGPLSPKERLKRYVVAFLNG